MSTPISARADSRRLEPAFGPLRGRVRPPGDKAISHRAAILGALADGVTEVEGFSPAGDCASTLGALGALGVRIEPDGDRLRVHGLGPAGAVAAPTGPVDCGRSGTTMRLLAGALAGMPVAVTLAGHPQLLARPMERVADPLRRMGARVVTADGGRPPIRIEGGSLTGLHYELPVASAQVKSAVLLAGLRAAGPTTLVEPMPTRDHTERMLSAMGARVSTAMAAGGGRRVSLAPGPLRAVRIAVPGDASSAAPVAAAAAAVAGSDVVLEGVGTNPGRTGFFRVLARMGAVVEPVPAALDPDSPGAEPVGDLRIRQAALRATAVEEAEVPSMIDELPLVGVLAALAEGTTTVRGAGELRVKESDRIAGLVAGLRALGAEARELPDGFEVRGPARLRGGAVDALADHRLAMAFVVAGLAAAGPVEVAGLEFVGDSFPGFLRALEALR